jgi:hypothetical protein
MSERDWRIFREDNDILIKGTSSATGIMGCPKPLRKWNEIQGLPEAVYENIMDMGFE